MHVSVRRYRNIGSVGDLVREIRLDFAPRLKSMPGFVAYYALDEGDGCLTTISVFSTAAMAAESNETAAAWMRERDAQNPLTPNEVVAGTLAIIEPPIRG